MLTFIINIIGDDRRIAVFSNDALQGQISLHTSCKEAEELLPKTQQLLKQLDIQKKNIGRIAVCIGPGGFTGTRIGLSAAKAWSFAQQIPIAGFSLFDCFKKQKDTVLIFSANRNQSWILFSQKTPVFINNEELQIPKKNSFAGQVHPLLEDELQKKGVRKKIVPMEFPHPSTLLFQREFPKPWYYKEATITWSKKIHL